jgi:hypothetical protein
MGGGVLLCNYIIVNLFYPFAAVHVSYLLLFLFPFFPCSLVGLGLGLERFAVFCS